MNDWIAYNNNTYSKTNENLISLYIFINHFMISIIIVYFFCQHNNSSIAFNNNNIVRVLIINFPWFNTTIEIVNKYTFRYRKYFVGYTLVPFHQFQCKYSNCLCLYYNTIHINNNDNNNNNKYSVLLSYNI